MADVFSHASGDPSGLQIIDPVLSNVARQFTPHGFVYDAICSPQPVEMNIGQYPVFELASFFRSAGENNNVADDATTPLIDIKYSTEFYHCYDYRLKTRLTNKELLQVNPALRLEISKLKALLSNMASEREIRLASALQYTGKSGGQLTLKGFAPEHKWDTGKEGQSALTTIQKDVQKAKREVYKQTGVLPNTLVITQAIAEAIAADPIVIEQLKYQIGVEMIEFGNASLPAKLWGLDIVCATGALQNLNAKGAATTNLQEIWGNTARVLYVNKAASWGEPTIAYSFRGKVASNPSTGIPTGTITQSEPDGNGSWAVVDRWVEPDPPAQNIRAWECVDEHIVAPELGIEIEEVLSEP